MEKKEKEVGWSRKTFLISLTAAIFGALYLTNDTYIMQKVIVRTDPFTAVSAYLILGGWIGVICNIAYNAWFGKKIDKDYPGLSFGNLKMQLSAVICGLIAAGSTAFCLLGNRSLDPSLMTAFSSLSLVYIVGYEGLRRVIPWKSILVPAILVIAGSVFASVVRLAGRFEITGFGILILLVGRCGTDALEKIIRQRGVWKSDAVTFNFWRFLWLSFSGTLLSVTIAVARGRLGELISLIQAIFWIALPWILLTMFFVFFSNTLQQKAMKTSAVSRVSMVLSFQIVLGIPLTLTINKIWPTVFSDIPSDPYVWVLRLIGAVMIVAGVVALRNNKTAQ